MAKSKKNLNVRTSKPQQTVLPSIVGIPECAEFLGVSIESVKYLAKTNQIPYFRMGKRAIRFNLDRIVEWTRERERVAMHYGKTATE